MHTFPTDSHIFWLQLYNTYRYQTVCSNLMKNHQVATHRRVSRTNEQLVPIHIRDASLERTSGPFTINRKDIAAGISPMHTGEGKPAEERNICIDRLLEALNIVCRYKVLRDPCFRILFQYAGWLRAVRDLDACRAVQELT